MANTIDVGEAGIVTVTANVLQTTNNAISQNGLFFSQSVRLPTDTITAFSSATSVGDFFGTTSNEYIAATHYFKGFDGSFKKPSEIIFYRKVSSAAPAWLLGGSLAAMTLTQLQALSGSLILDINGESRGFVISFGITSAKLLSGELPSFATLKTATGSFTITIDGTTQEVILSDLSGATSITDLTAIIESDIQNAFEIAEITCGYNVSLNKFVIASPTTGSGSTITIATAATGSAAADLKLTTATGAFAFAQHAAATSFSNAAQILDAELNNVFTENPVTAFDITANAFRITTLGAGATKTITFATGTLADNLKLRQADGAIASQGFAITSYSDSINNVWESNTKDFISVTSIETMSESEYLDLASWITGKNDCAILFVHTTDAAVVDSQSVTDVNSVIADAGYNCIRGVYGTFESAAAQCGFVACLDFDTVNGWGTLAFKQQSGLPVIEMTVSDCVVAKSKGYIFHSAFSTRASRVNFDYLGSFGDWAYPDVLAAKIVIQDRAQVSILDSLLASSIPNNQAGRAQIRATLSDSVFDVGKLSGAISTGETLSQAQREKINQLLNDPNAYKNVESNGYYIKLTDKVPSDTSRNISGIAVYSAGGFVHSVDLAINVQVN